MSLVPAIATSFRPFRAWIPSALALGLLALAPRAAASPDPAFAAAVANLKHQRDTAGPSLETATLTGWNEAFFDRIDLSTLGPREIAQIHRLNAFAYGDKVKVHAKYLVVRLEMFAAAPDAEGALAAALLVPLSGPGGRGPQRSGWESAALQHPAYVALLHGEFGDIALDIACRTAPRDDAKRAFMLGLADKLDATHSVAAAGMVMVYWNRLTQFVPEGEQRQAIRQRLVDYLSAAEARAPDDASRTGRKRIADYRAQLEGAQARGLLLGRPAADLNFVWSSRQGWKSLDDLRGKVVVLDFWATWCGPCVESFPEVAKLVERYRGSEVEIVGVTSVQGTVVGLGPKAIDCRGDPEKEMRLMQDYIPARGITWPVVFSREPVMNPDYGVDGIPTTVVVAPDGTIRYKATGYVGAKLVKAIDDVLAEFKLPVPPVP